jgi:hypothetical protein
MQLPKSSYDQQTTPMQSHINVGCGLDVTIAELSYTIAQTVGYSGQLEFDPTKPDGAPRKWMDSSRLNSLGWQAKVELHQGLASAYQDLMSKLNYPMTQLETMNNLVRGAPLTQTATSSSQTTPPPSFASQLAGMGLTGLSLYNMFGQK